MPPSRTRDHSQDAEGSTTRPKHRRTHDHSRDAEGSWPKHRRTHDHSQDAEGSTTTRPKHRRSHDRSQHAEGSSSKKRKHRRSRSNPPSESVLTPDTMASTPISNHIELLKQPDKTEDDHDDHDHRSRLVMTPQAKSVLTPQAKPVLTQARSLAMWEIIANDRLGRKVRVKCSPDDSIEDLKKLIAAQTGTDWRKIRIKKWYTEYRHVPGITVGDVFIDGESLELY